MKNKTIDTAFLRKYYEREALEENRQEEMYRGDAHDSYWQNIRFNEIKQIFEKISVKTFLEVGCAEGLYITTYKEFNRTTKFIGLDIARNYLKKIRVKDNEILLIQGDANNLPFKSDCFDLVLCSETLEHVIDPKKSFFELCRVSKKYLIIAVPGHTPFFFLGKYFGIVKEASISDTFGAPGRGHINELDVNCIKRYLSEKNIRYTIIKQKTYCYFPPLPMKKYHIPLSVVKLMDKVVNKMPFLSSSGLVQVLALKKW